MAYVVEKKSTLLVPSGSFRNPEAHHLFVIATDPCEQNQCVLVTISTIYEGVWYDPTCTIEADSHPFVKHASYVNYRFSVLKDCERLGKLVDGWYYHPKDPIDDQVLENICSGILKSDFTPRYVQKYYANLLNL